jgi:Ca-activated chloride channel family protein
VLLRQPIVEIAGNKPQQKNPAMDFIDEGLLQRIANETGGRYFRAKDKEGLANIYKQIDQLEKSKVEVMSYKRHEEKFLPFALALLLFFFRDITPLYHPPKISLIRLPVYWLQRYLLV